MNDATRNTAAESGVRIDKWLWAARFFKTRSLATAAIKGGHVALDGHRTKASATVRPGQTLRVVKAEQIFELEVVDVSDKRGPATAAETLYRETEQSRERRAAAAEERRIAHRSMPRPAARPDKKDRRRLRRFKQGDGNDG